jgi:hypothetical protein
MTSSARARIAGGIVSPSALAVFRLTTSSIFVDCLADWHAGIGLDEDTLTREIFGGDSPVP